MATKSIYHNDYVIAPYESWFSVQPIICDEFNSVIDALILQYIHGWLITNKKDPNTWHDGKVWMLGGARRFKEKGFGWLDEKTIKDCLKKLTDDGYLISNNTFNECSYDRTNWYTIDYDLLQERLGEEVYIKPVTIPKRKTKNTITLTVTDNIKQEENEIAVIT